MKEKSGDFCPQKTKDRWIFGIPLQGHAPASGWSAALPAVRYWYSSPVAWFLRRWPPSIFAVLILRGLAHHGAWPFIVFVWFLHLGTGLTLSNVLHLVLWSLSPPRCRLSPTGTLDVLFSTFRHRHMTCHLCMIWLLLIFSGDVTLIFPVQI